MSSFPNNFQKIKKEDLPSNITAKYKVGDLVKVQPGNPESLYGFYINGGMGVIADIVFFKAFGFETYSPQIFYMIEYKIKWVENDEYGFVLEHSLQLMEI